MSKRLHYNQHPFGTKSRKDIPHRKSMARPWRLSDGRKHEVKVTRLNGRKVAA